MNRKQFQLFAGKLYKMATQIEADARRVNATGSPGSEFAARLRESAAEIRSIARSIESYFG